MDPLIESTEPAYFPLSYYDQVALKFAGQPSQIEKYNKGVHEAALVLSCMLMVCVKNFKSTVPNGVKVDWNFEECGFQRNVNKVKSV